MPCIQYLRLCTAVCCGVVQCVALCCSVLQRFTVCCSERLHSSHPSSRSVLQHVAARRSALHFVAFVAFCCSERPVRAFGLMLLLLLRKKYRLVALLEALCATYMPRIQDLGLCFAECCSALLSIAVCCNVSHSVAVCCIRQELRCQCLASGCRSVFCSGVLACVAVRCCLLQCYVQCHGCIKHLHASLPESRSGCCRVLRYVGLCCSVLQCLAVCCCVL